ncbi:hypothetical protein D1000_04945 [Riemerella anatipestifer]|uniref:hypothetical protein n=1 Tax=Riemerella anatipestifer TaxID=34085 RepID=UPI0004DC4251|nr:hypothetical protein [Riemerella anatipestifer]AIH01753.1 hypothetical protein M949_0582 [Riemerella anatipestifer CH3]MDR7693905.1 hypothetical protein [Riemerella anatipestifer]MDR7793941.1 hypothetical protein [Riemerella anatipestifer]MDY3536705.1 hypothetical protein [Riemerella anatipestifer]MRN16178.1 hypothetical protein [Riemerella anatipestifer]
MIIVCQKLLKNTKITGIAIFPFIFLRTRADKTNKKLVNHEKIHLRQQLELGLVFFYLWYVLEFYYRLYQYKNPHLAYINICFEREAYANESNLHYLKERSFWAFLKYK